LRIRGFRVAWIAGLVASVGSWMHLVGVAWQMTSLTSSALLIALIDTAMSLPIFLLGLPAGAIGDVVDRRRFLLVGLSWSALVAGTLGVFALVGFATPALLLGFTLAFGIGGVMTVPVWQAVTPELVPREELPAAIALNGIALNLSRAIGPAIGGLLLAVANPGYVFLLNAAVFVALIVVVRRWRRPVVESPLPAERFLGAIRAGWRYARNAPDFRAVCARAALFLVFGSAVWALLPVVGRQRLGLEASGYGLLVGTLGVGAVTAAVFIPGLRRALSTEVLVGVATVSFAGAAVLLAFARNVPLAFLAMLLAGAGWISALSTLNTAAQQTSAMWVRTRALAVYSLAFQGGVAVGSASWGAVASTWGVDVALSAVAAGLVGGLVLARRYPLPGRVERDLSPSLHWPQPLLVTEAAAEDGPVLVSVEYRVGPEDADAFLSAVHDLARVRRRDGAFEWAVYRDTADPTRYVEVFLVESWAEHLRQHDRVTVADRELEATVESWHDAESPVRVDHLLYARRPPKL
jgi:MFS family permease